jgi:hypothetical protein
LEGDELLVTGEIEDLPYPLGPLDEVIITLIGVKVRSLESRTNLRFLWADTWDPSADRFSWACAHQLQTLKSLQSLSIHQFHARRYSKHCRHQSLVDLGLRDEGDEDKNIILNSIGLGDFSNPKYNQPWTTYRYSPPTLREPSSDDDLEDLNQELSSMFPGDEHQLHLRGGASTPNMLDLATPDPGSPTGQAGSNYHTPGSEILSAEVDAQLSEDIAEAMSSPSHVRQSRKRERDEDEDDKEPVAGDASPLYVVEKLRALRETPQGREILVEWEDYPDETDWTWETEKSLKESVPDMIEEWQRARAGSIDLGTDIAEKQEFEIKEVEKIIYCRHIKKVPHYLVSWKGYPKKKDQTWERCDKLKADVPTLVDEYERRRKRRKKGSNA